MDLPSELRPDFLLGPFENYKRMASLAEKVEREGGDPSREVQVVTFRECSQCRKVCVNKEGYCTAKTCGGCMAYWYCGKGCQKKHWSTANASGERHRDGCKKAKMEMLHHPSLLRVFHSFPWSELKPNQPYVKEILLARFRLLDASPEKVGYWAKPGSFGKYDKVVEGSLAARVAQERGTLHVNEYRHGAILLDSERWDSLTDEGGWKLDDNFLRGHGGKLFRRDPATRGRLIPRLHFDAANPPPSEPPGRNIVDWDSWYQWRGLSKESPVVLLMDYPLAVYYLVTKVLGVISEQELEWNNGEELEEGKSRKRRHLKLHYLGAESELNFLPIFSELALLIPNVDITLTFFGPSVHSLLAHAQSHLPFSPAGRVATGTSSDEEVIYHYTAPETLGGSTIKMILHGKKEVWADHPSSEFLSNEEIKPDALVALNAGLLVYPTWRQVIMLTWLGGIPFATTESAESELNLAVEEVLDSIVDRLKEIPNNENLFLGLPTIAGSSATEARKPWFEVKLSPFACPGQREIPTVGLPNINNGFFLKVSQAPDLQVQLNQLAGTECMIS